MLRGSFATPSGISREPESLLRRVLVLEPHQRYTIVNVVTHAWMCRRSNEGDIVTEHAASQKLDGFCREQMLEMGFPADVVDASLASERHDHIYTVRAGDQCHVHTLSKSTWIASRTQTYLLLLRKKLPLVAHRPLHSGSGAQADQGGV